ncbi:substrate-binding periplasmic protein [Massilia sp. TWR1-2-2]|uniref:substrate-binding periplasmic protein n=1 Tax=Massilia sp. TWR1-2-2 TaxID=2804584 RepID=UPI003CF12826
MSGDIKRGRLARWLAFALLVASNAAARDQMTVQIMAQESIPPKWLIEGGPPHGLCPEILEAIERLEPQLKFSGFDRGRSLLVIENALQTGRVSAACGLLDSPRRQSVAIRLRVPLYDVKHKLAAAADDLQVVNNFDDLVRLKPLVNTARGSAYILQLKALGIAVDDSTGDSIVNLRKILHGHGRYTYMNELSLRYFIQAGRLEDKLRILPAVFNQEPVYFWVSRKADPALAPVIERALARLKANGELARIYERWSRPR